MKGPFDADQEASSNASFVAETVEVFADEEEEKAVQEQPKKPRMANLKTSKKQHSKKDIPTNIFGEEATSNTSTASTTSSTTWSFRQKDDDVLVLVLYKIFALTSVDNIDQTFSVNMGEEMAIWLSEDEYNRFLQDPKNFEPDFCPETFPYNGTDYELDDSLLTADGCRFYVRKLTGHQPDYGNKCFAWIQRMGRVTFDEPFELENFPFDVQHLTMIIQYHSYFHDPNINIRIRPLYGGASYARRFVEPNGEYRVYKDISIFETPENNRFPQVCCTFCIRREWRFYFWKVVFVLSIISLTSVLALVEFGGFLDQIGHLSTILLTDVAYLYIVSTYMPNKRYLTLMDKFVMGNILYVVAIFIEVAVVQLSGLDVAYQKVGKTGWEVGQLLLVASFASWFLMNFGFIVRSYFAYHEEGKKLLELTNMKSSK